MLASWSSNCCEEASEIIKRSPRRKDRGATCARSGLQISLARTSTRANRVSIAVLTTIIGTSASLASLTTPTIGPSRLRGDRSSFSRRERRTEQRRARDRKVRKDHDRPTRGGSWPAQGRRVMRTRFLAKRRRRCRRRAQKARRNRTGLSRVNPSSRRGLTKTLLRRRTKLTASLIALRSADLAAVSPNSP